MEHQLPGGVLQSVFAKADASDCARAACVDRRWQQNSNDENLWRMYCLRDFAVTSPLDHRGNPCQTFKAAYRSWRQCFEEYPMSLVARTKRCLDQIKDWLNVHYIEVLQSLAPGASAEEIEAAEEELGFQIPPPVRLLYRLCNGQEFQDDEVYDETPPLISNHLGLLGGYYFYDHFVNVHLLPLRQVVKLTLAIVPKLQLPEASRRLVIAASCNSVKIFFLDCNDGQVYVGTRNLQMDGEMMPCTPNQGEVDPKDGMIRWLEWYGYCLRSEMYNVRVEKGIRSISLFPLKEPLCTQATTRGIQIRSSAVFVPELSKLEEGEGDSYLFSYSVRMCLLALNSANGDSSLESVQLLARHWVIQPNGFSKLEVRAEAVLGMYPFLPAGGEEFVYESCTGLQSRAGFIEGDFTFVPGRIVKREGADFVAYVPRVRLEVPPYIF